MQGQVFLSHLTFDLATMALTLVNLVQAISPAGFSNFITMVTMEGCCAWACLVYKFDLWPWNSDLVIVTHVRPLTRALKIYMMGCSNLKDMSI